MSYETTIPQGANIVYLKQLDITIQRILSSSNITDEMARTLDEILKEGRFEFDREAMSLWTRIHLHMGRIKEKISEKEFGFVLDSNPLISYNGVPAKDGKNAVSPEQIWDYNQKVAKATEKHRMALEAIRAYRL